MASIDVDLNVVVEELLNRIKVLTLENVVLTKALEMLDQADPSSEDQV